MANFQSKTKIRTAVEKNYPLHGECDHTTTANLMHITVAKNIWLPKGSWKVKGRGKTLMKPLPQPTFGKIIMQKRGFFVPFWTIFPGFNDMITDTMHTTGSLSSYKVTEFPHCTFGDLATAIDAYATPVSTPSSNPNNFDYSYVDSNNVTQYRLLGDDGKRMYSLAVQLFGKFALNPSNTRHCNILNLLALTKIYCDYYYNNSYKGDTIYNQLKELYSRDNGNLSYSAAQVSYMLNYCMYTFYDDSIYTDVWDNPNHPNIANQESNYTINDIAAFNYTGYQENTAVTRNMQIDNDLGDPALNAYGGGTVKHAPNTAPRITQQGLSLLRGLSAYLKRHQLAGASMLGRFLARYGAAPQENIKEARELGKDNTIIEISPIFSNSDTAATGGESLGEYAGNGYGESNWITYEVDTNDWGVFMELVTLNPKVKYVEGTDPTSLVATKLDLWTPEFDNIGVEIVPAAVVKTSNYAGEVEQTQNMYLQAFGFLPRYAFFKTLRDQMSGDYIIGQYENLYRRYILMREFASRANVTDWVHAKEFTQGLDAYQYLKIFYGFNPGAKARQDYFNMYFEYQIDGISNMKPLYDVYEWEHEDGKEITTYQGAREN